MTIVFTVYVQLMGMYKSELLEMQQALLMIDINSLQFVAVILIFGLHSRFPFCTNATE